jgi:hypothetical protein
LEGYASDSAEKTFSGRQRSVARRGKQSYFGTAMRKIAAPLLLPALFLLASWCQAQEVTMVPGYIRAIKVEGTVWQISKGSGQRERLKEGDFLLQGNAVVTTSNGRVILLFQNGSTINLQPGTRFAVDEFLVDPFPSEELDYRKMKAEPSQSVTRLRVDEGTITSKVAKLKADSAYDVTTPLGAAGIRGTVVTFKSGTDADFYVVTEGEIEASKDGQSFWIAGGAKPGAGGNTRTGRAGPMTDQTIIISPDEDYTPPPGEAEQLAAMGQSFSESVSGAIPSNPFSGAEETDGSDWGATDSGGDSGGGGSGGGSPPPLPGGFGGGGGGGSGGSTTTTTTSDSGGGGIYSN